MAGAGEEALPLRPLTVGEVLDAATNLLRRYARPLLSTALVLAVLEQVALYPLRRAAGVGPPWYWPAHFGAQFRGYWLLLAAGFGTESIVVTLLGGLAGRAAVADLIGRRPGRLLGRAARPWPLAALALVAGALAAAAAAAGFVPWLVWYALVGLSGPALVVDRVPVPGRVGPSGLPPTRGLGPLGAIGRSWGLVGSARGRPGRIRLLGYLAWWSIRLALGGGSVSLLRVVLPGDSPFWWPAAMAVWAIVDTLAYAALGCLDAALHLETRMRVEGLDIAVSRAVSTGRPVEPALAVPR
jgi:hypothetical protein